MTSSITTRSARASAREAARRAAEAAQEAIAARTRRNTEDLAAYFSALERGRTVDDWLEERMAVLRAQAEGRRVEHRRACGAALAAMRERGESVRDIARMAGIGENAARELMRLARAAEMPQDCGGEPAAAVRDGGGGDGQAAPWAAGTNGAAAQ